MPTAEAGAEPLTRPMPQVMLQPTPIVAGNAAADAEAAASSAAANTDAEADMPGAPFTSIIWVG